MRSHIRWLSGLAGLVLTLLLLAPLGVTQAAIDWQIEIVDATGDVGYGSALALDSQDQPHISYHDYTNGDLKYAAFDGTTWRIETVDSDGDVGFYTSLALDSQNHPHISYYDNTNGDLKYAAFDGTTWRIETVDEMGDVGIDISLALDSQNRPHISYHDETNEDLKYATFDGTDWQIETVDSEGDVGLYNSLALDSQNQPHISYYDFKGLNGGALKYAAYDGSTWLIEIVDATGDGGRYSSLALDSDDQPNISYLDYDNTSLKYATYDGSAWQTETVDAGGFVGEFSSLELDSQNHPHISYFDTNNLQLEYATFDGMDWQLETVDAVQAGWYASLALDSRDQPHISYSKTTRDGLKYATATVNQAPTFEVGDPYTGSEGSPISIGGTVSDPEGDALTTTWSYAIGAADAGTTCSFADASEVNTTITCTDDGTFTLTLTADDGNNPPVSASTSLTISNVAPTVTLDEPGETNEGDTFSSGGSFSEPGTNDLLSITINYGDGSTTHVPDVDAGSFIVFHIYLQSGQYTIEVCVTDDDQGQDCDEQVVTVLNVTPTVTLGEDVTINEGDTFSGSGSFSDPSTNDSHTATVDFGVDGAQEIALNDDGSFTFSHTYPQDSQYTVRVCVSDGQDTGCDEQVVTVLNVAPTVTLGEDVQINSGDTYTDTGSFTDPGIQDTHTATVDYGDGSGVQPLPLDDGGFSLSHTYLDHGQFTVVVCVIDDVGGQGCDELLVTVINQPPTVDVGGPYSGTEGSPITLDGVVSDPENDDLTIGWSYGYALGAVDPGTTCTFGDLSQAETTITCTDDGTFSLGLFADDGVNPRVDDFIIITISNAAPSITLDDDVTLDEGDAFLATGSVSDPGANDTHTATIDYGDGSGVQALALNPDGTFDLSHDYLADDGQYTLEVCATDDDGDLGCDDQLVTVLNVAPTITEIDVDVSGSEAAVTVDATDPAGDNDPLSYGFDCDNNGDYEVGPQPGTSATCDFGSHEGSFTIGVQVSDGDGGVTTGEVAVVVASNLCASNHTGILRYSDACRDYETVVTIASEEPVTICASTHNGLLRAPANGTCQQHEISYLLPEDGPLSVCVNGYTQVMRAVNDISQCVDHEFGRVIAATEIEVLPPPQTR